MAFVINGHTVGGGFCDADFIERYEGALAQYRQDSERVKRTKFDRPSEGLRATVATLDALFDNAFGEGTAAEVFANAPGDALLRVNALIDLNKQVREQQKDLNDLLNRAGQLSDATTTPGANRQNRRKRHK